MNETTKETITISRTTYELITEYFDLLNEISDRYIFNVATIHAEAAHLQLARWAVAYEIKKAIDGNVSSLVEQIAIAKNTLDMLKDLEH